MNSKKIEIIDISLDLDISEEIKKRTDNINEEIKSHTKKIAEKAKMKVQKTKSQKEKEREIWSNKCGAALKYLIEAKENGTELVPGDQILKVMQLESTSLQSAVQRLRSYLKKNSKWVLERKKISNQSCYRLKQFSDQTP